MNRLDSGSIKRLTGEYDQSERDLGSTNPATIAAKRLLANALYDSGRYRGAVKLQQEILSVTTTLYSQSDYEVVYDQLRLSMSLIRVGDLTNAKALLLVARESMGTNEMGDTKAVISILTNLSKIAMMQNNPVSASEFMQEAIVRYPAYFTSPNDALIVMARSCAYSHRKSGHYHAAALWEIRAIRWIVELHGLDIRKLLRPLLNLKNDRKKWGNRGASMEIVDSLHEAIASSNYLRTVVRFPVRRIERYVSNME